MQSKTSWFSPALFKKNMTRFWPLWAGYGVLWLCILPLNFLLNAQGFFGQSAAEHIEQMERFAMVTVRDMGSVTVYTTFAVGILAAMAVFSYLYNNRSAGLMHSLPLRREGLFLTNYLSGLTFLAGPAVLTFFVTLAAEAATGVTDALALGQWLVTHLLCALFFYSFAVFCAMFTGHILALPVFYGILSFLAYFVYAVLDGVFDQLLYGYNQIHGMSDLMVRLCPVVQLGGDVQADRVYNEIGELLSVTYHGIPTALVYGFMGIVLAVAALLIYRRRQVETAGDVVSVALVRPVFKYGVGVCAGMAVGTLLYYWFGQQLLGGGALPMLAFFLPCGAVGYFSAEMLLQKSFRVFSQWKGCLAMLAGIALLLGALAVDVFGFATHIPDAAQVKSVSVGNVHTAPSDGFGSWSDSSEDIEAVLEIHRALVEERESIKAVADGENYGTRQELYSGNVKSVAISEETYSVETRGINDFQVEYVLSDGSLLTRHYQIPITQEMLEDPDSYASKIEALYNQPDRAAEHYGFPTAEHIKLALVTTTAYDEASGTMRYLTLNALDAQDLYRAVQADLAAGRLGRRYLLDSQERMEQCYYNDLDFNFYDTRDTGGDGEKAMWSVRVTMQTTATETIRVLTDMGLLNETQRLMTRAEYATRGDTITHDGEVTEWKD